MTNNLIGTSYTKKKKNNIMCSHRRSVYQSRENRMSKICTMGCEKKLFMVDNLNRLDILIPPNLT